MKQQTIKGNRQRREGGRKGRLILVVTGPLKGLAYIILLPLVGTFAIFLLGIRRLGLMLQALLVVSRGNGNLGRAS